MLNIRNVRDPIPLGMSRTVMARYARMASEKLGIAPGRGVAEAFTRLGGRFTEVASTFGRRGDRILVHSSREVEFEGEGSPADNLVGLGEALCAMIVHRPASLATYGDDVRIAVPRFIPDGPFEAVRGELIWFGIELVIPADDFRARHAAGQDEGVLASAYGVGRREVRGRMKALGLVAPDPLPEASRLTTSGSVPQGARPCVTDQVPTVH